MSIWMDDIKDPKMKAAYKVVGNQSRDSLRRFVYVMRLTPWLNTTEQNNRWDAATYILENSEG